MKKITSICLTIFLGVNIVSAYAARGEQLAILSEDFSAFTEGTESTPAESELSTGNAMIPMEFTHGIQWKGRGIHQAGGVCAVLSYDDYTYGETQGWIQTPYTDVRLDDGNFILRFRARSIAQTKDSLILICKINIVATIIRVRNAPLPTNGKRSKFLFSTISVWGVAWPMYKSGHTTIRG